LDDDDTDASMCSEEEKEEPPPPCGPLQAALLGSFETAHRESSIRAVRAVILEPTNATIANRVAKISVEFAAKEAAAKRLMAAEQRAARELEEKATCDDGYPAWQEVERRPKRRWRRRGLRRRRLGRRRRASLPSRGSSSTSATMTPRLAAVHAIRSQEAGCWSPLTLARAALFLPKKARTSTMAAALANSGVQTANICNKIYVNLNEKTSFALRDLYANLNRKNASVKYLIGSPRLKIEMVSAGNHN
jgi:hypothetical protein